uniref:F-box domain-containing protein n=1 Tax=Meloidogyne incognita TaxID=6306 RepID=A0A914KM53_MELIC
MKNLPNEVKIDIFKCLDFCQLNKARLLNKQFCALIDQFAGKLACKREVYRPPLTRRCGRFFVSFGRGVFKF